MKRLGNHSQKGAVLVFAALMLPIMVFFGGMAIDFGRAYLYKSHLQNAADAAALAGVTAAAGCGTARLIETLPSGDMKIGGNDKLSMAKNAANVILIKDIGEAGANDSNTILRMRKEGKDPKLDVDTYYYMVELTDEVKMVFAQLFLPKSLLPNDWNVKVSAKAWAKAKIGEDLDSETFRQLEKETAANFYEWQKHAGGDFATAQQLSFTNPGVAYDYEHKTRSEVFNMNEIVAERKDVFINFRQDISAKSAFADTWDLSDFRGKSYDEISELFYDLSSAEKKARVWLDIPKNNGTLNYDTITLDQFIRNYAKAVDGINNLNNITGNDFNNYANIDKALEMLTSTVKDTINVNVAYSVRQVDSLPESEVSFVYGKDERNRQDPLFVRIESEEFNSSDNGRATNSASGGVTNSVRDISININVDNTVKVNDEYIYRPMVFFYEGPMDAEGNHGVGRKSNTVVVELNENFRGIIYAPNSPVQVKGRGKEFNGYIIAQRIIGPDGEDLTDEMPSRQNNETNATLQAFYERLGLSEAKYDDFDVVKLTVYKKPEKDVIYLTSRARITV